MPSIESGTILVAENMTPYYIIVCAYQQIIINLNSYLFICKLNNPKVSYKEARVRGMKQQ
jgi:hypothetical protein